MYKMRLHVAREIATWISLHGRTSSQNPSIGIFVSTGEDCATRAERRPESQLHPHQLRVVPVKMKEGI